jgi:hypothetical protein
MKKKYLAAAIGALLVSGSAMAVEVNHGGMGDVLLAPVFMAGGGWTTELRLVNNNTVDSAVVKAVFHRPGRSEELLDFLIYLTPGDVWTGSVVANANGTVGIQSSDDSSVVTSNGANFCPTTTNAVYGKLDPTDAKFTVPDTTGYVNFFESRMVRGLGAAPVLKTALVAEYVRLCNLGAAIGFADTDNSLSGQVTLSNSLNGSVMSLPMTALSNYDNAAHLRVGVQTSFGTNATVPGSVSGLRNVEDALWASDYSIPYDNSPAVSGRTFGIFSFPTKEAYRGSVGTQYTPFLTNALGAPAVLYEVRNEQELMLGTVGCRFSPCDEAKNLSLPNEVNFVAITTGGKIADSTVAQINTETHTKGWVRAMVESVVSPTTEAGSPNYNNRGQSGSPALVTVIQWNLGTKGQDAGHWTYAAKQQFSGQVVPGVVRGFSTR